MARVILKAYELGNNSVVALTQDQVRAKYSPNLFPKSQGKFWEKWYELKDIILTKDAKKGIKKVDDIIYYSHKLGNNTFLIFAIGDDKKETLEKIYLKEKESNGDSTNSVLTENTDNQPKAEAKTVAKSETKSASGSEWDLSDTSKSINEHIKAILDKKKVTGKFNEEQSKEVLKLLGSGNTIKTIMDKKDYSKLAPTLIKSLNSIKSVIEYTIFDLNKIGKIIQGLGEEAKNPDFEQNLEEAKDYEFDFNTIMA